MSHNNITRPRSNPSRRRGLAGSLLILALAGSGMMACSDDILITLSPQVAILYGDVVAEGDPRVPVEGVTVRARYFLTRFGGCDVEDAPRTLPATTDAAGYYRVAIADGSGDPYCVTVEATPPAGSGLAPAASGPVEVTTSLPPDSARVDIVLRPAGEE